MLIHMNTIAYVFMHWFLRDPISIFKCEITIVSRMFSILIVNKTKIFSKLKTHNSNM